MMTENFPVETLKGFPTPFYYYDLDLLNRTLDTLQRELDRYGYHQHYAVKANANPRILAEIARRGMGADCVSGGEIRAALDAGFAPGRIVFAGVGKADWEINLGLERDIACFNVESLAELHVLDALAAAKGKTASAALRINPDVDAHTHEKITTGRRENKFGINTSLLPGVLDALGAMRHVRFTGIHFHIGSQITDLYVFGDLCIRANALQDEIEARGLTVENLNFGGGLGIDYQQPDEHPVPDFENYFATFHQLVRQRPGQQVHFELGRAVVAQCGALISKALYMKEGESRKFAVLDAGFTDLIRPAMYGAYHHIENLTSDGDTQTYDVVGPICESSDVFGQDVRLTEVRRHDLLALRSAGAYGEIMASQYNCRPLPKAFFSDEP
ncbi:MAG: diaminopimelate decarboxylase [Tannerella sp.]|jgi:diaminopimelate decarboxylase|nr:diaminopimelate decarboxylase [Tannerella sp.]